MVKDKLCIGLKSVAILAMLLICVSCSPVQAGDDPFGLGGSSPVIGQGSGMGASGESSSALPSSAPASSAVVMPGQVAPGQSDLVPNAKTERPLLGADASGVGAWAADGNDYIDLRLLSPVTGTGELNKLTIAVEMRMQPGWHSYWRTPGDSGLPLMLDFTAVEGVKSAEIRWPAPVRHELYGFFTHVYYDHVIIPVDLELSAPGAGLVIDPKTDVQVCDDQCFPVQPALSLTIPAGPADLSDAAVEINRAVSALPSSPSISGLEMRKLHSTSDGKGLQAEIVSLDPFGETPELFIEHETAFLPMGWPDWTFAEDRLSATAIWPYSTGKPPGDFNPDGQAVTITLTDQGRALEQQVTIGGEAGASSLALLTGSDAKPDRSLMGFVLLAILGGLILNLMPCVLPVLSLKMLSVVKSAGKQRSEIRAGFLATAAGILVSFMVLATALVALKGAGQAVGWGIQFQQPVFLVLLLLVVLGFAANMFGWFEIVLPSALGGKLATAGSGEGTHPLAGSFVTGVFATLLATPCSAPFLGTAVGFALAGGTVDVYIIFAALGVGLALPYLMVAALPGLAQRLPRPGAWMAKVKFVLGLLLVGTALWLASVIIGTSGLVAALGVAVASTALFGMIWARHRLPLDKRHVMRPALVMLALAALASPRLFHVEQPAAQQDMQAGWAAFSPERLAAEVASGKVVFVDITADWCLTCKVNKKMVMDTDQVAAALTQPGHIALRGDWTRRGDDIQIFLASHGRYGIPFNIIYGPGAPDGIILNEVLTTDAVLKALEQARTGPVAQTVTD
ncbi:MAG: protein-disulfide reductase DsbD family protein [Alphaproteobacteria bacterium]